MNKDIREYIYVYSKLSLFGFFGNIFNNFVWNFIVILNFDKLNKLMDL